MYFQESDDPKIIKLGTTDKSGVFFKLAKDRIETPVNWGWAKNTKNIIEKKM
jgi:hypothetical protein